MIGLTALLLLIAQEPVRTAWILSTQPASGGLSKVRPEVHSVAVGERFVEVRSAGLSLTYLGPFQNPLSADGGVRELVFRIPRVPELASSPQRTGPGVVGVFLNGVPLYNRFAGASYLGQNMWHFDTIALAARDQSHPMSLGALESVVRQDGSRHSPLLGFALDGFPIYGPWGSAGRARSGYRLRPIQERTVWPDGTVLTPAQYGPPVSPQFPLGAFVEDYEYSPRAGELDEFNGRFAVTPEYPQTYAYFLTTDDSNRLAYPYLLGERYRGNIDGALATRPSQGRIRFEAGSSEAGKPARLALSFHKQDGAPVRFLEIVHERPVHLMVVSQDLDDFAHIHPEWRQGDVYEVWHAFSKPGRYRLFAQFTLPGEAEQVATFDITVQPGAAVPKADTPAPSLSIELVKPPVIRAGEDLTFAVKLRGATIEPYLGAWAHFVWIDLSLQQFIHAHPFENATAVLDPNQPHVHGVSDAPSGPPPASVQFATNFARPGKYKLWAQFQVTGRPVVFPFVIDVAAPLPVVSRAVARIPSGAIRLRVDERGFTPARLEATRGPATLAVERSNTPNCGSKIVFPKLGISRDLPVGETTLIELPPLKGDVAFTCGMGMYRGLIVAKSVAP